MIGKKIENIKFCGDVEEVRMVDWPVRCAF